MKTVILCGGKGTRIREVEETLPKPMLPIGPLPIVQHVMAIYGAQGHRDFVLCLGHLGWRLRQYFANLHLQIADVEIDLRPGGRIRCLDPQRLPHWRVTLAETGDHAQTGARIARIRQHVGNEPFFLTYGDGLADIDLAALLKFHQAHGRLATVTAVHPPSRFGELELDGMEVRAFREKPRHGNSTISGGFFVLEPGVFDYLDEGDDCVFERQPLQRLVEDGQLCAYDHRGFWMPMDTPREFAMLNELWATGAAPWSPERLCPQEEAEAVIPQPCKDQEALDLHV